MMDFDCIGGLMVAALLGLIPAAIAYNKGKNFFAWWLFGAALFIIALPAAILTDPEPETLEWRQLKTGWTKRCMYCAEIVKWDAIVCKHCGSEMDKHGGGK